MSAMGSVVQHVGPAITEAVLKEMRAASYPMADDGLLALSLERAERDALLKMEQADRVERDDWFVWKVAAAGAGLAFCFCIVSDWKRARRRTPASEGPPKGGE